MPGFKSKKIRIKTVGELRKSKLANVAGCGSLVDFPGFSGMMGGLNLWNPFFSEDMKIREMNLERFLKVSFFVQPVSDKKKNNYSREYEIPIVRFPEYYYCPKCHALDYARRIAQNLKNDYDHTVPLKCNKCHEELLPSRFVAACNDGHIEDFPYVWWAHKKEGKTCDRPRLKLSYMGKTGGFESMIVECETCGAWSSMSGCLQEQALTPLQCHGNRPWLGPKGNCSCEKNLRALMQASTNVYYPMTISALTIPPWSSSIQKQIQKDDSYFRLMFQSGNMDFVLEGIKTYYRTNRIQEFFKCTEDDFINEVNARYMNHSELKETTGESILRDEYLAFVGPDKDDFYFKTESAEIDVKFQSFISNVKLVKRLREVQALYGFRRIVSAGDEAGMISPLSVKKEEWLPAVELLGEGIFIEFSRQSVTEWLRKNEGRYKKMKDRYEKKGLNRSLHGDFSAIYVLVHTISHLLIRELSEACGYDESSLKERLYISGSVEDEEWMCGLLIYTAVSSSDGSLGGLVRLGREQNLSEILFSMIRKAEWCSNDPVCIESESQGLDSLNYSACHACALIPETSCERNNILLDRKAVIGTSENPESGYFAELYRND